MFILLSQVFELTLVFNLGFVLWNIGESVNWLMVSLVRYSSYLARNNLVLFTTLLWIWKVKIITKFRRDAVMTTMSHHTLMLAEFVLWRCDLRILFTGDYWFVHCIQLWEFSILILKYLNLFLQWTYHLIFIRLSKFKMFNLFFKLIFSRFLIL